MTGPIPRDHVAGGRAVSHLVDTSNLRALVRLLLDGPPADTPVETWAIIHQVRRPFFAAADEVDRLRDELADWRSYAAKEKRAWQVENVKRKDAEDKNDRLRDAIEKAPHDRDESCGFGVDPRDMSTCTCWKADAL